MVIRGRDGLYGSLSTRRAAVIELVHVGLETVVVFGRISAVGAIVLYGLRVRLEVRAQHGQIDARVLAL